VTALIHHENQIGSGVIIGSNVFNLAALLGLGALVAGRIGLHRKVILLDSSVALPIAGVCVLTVIGIIPPLTAVLIVGVIFIPYVVILGPGSRHLPVPTTWRRWLDFASREEEKDLAGAVVQNHRSATDGLVAAGALVAVVLASAAMEQAGSAIGGHLGWPQIVTGGVLLASATSLPNAVAGVYLARRGKGAAVLSTTLNSNSINVGLGLLLPSVFLGIGRASTASIVIAAWYAILTLIVLAWAFRRQGLTRIPGVLIIGCYGAFLGVLLRVSGES
jgi:cation:H+ antiporter